MRNLRHRPIFLRANYAASPALGPSTLCHTHHLPDEKLLLIVESPLWALYGGEQADRLLKMLMRSVDPPADLVLYHRERGGFVVR